MAKKTGKKRSRDRIRPGASNTDAADEAESVKLPKGTDAASRVNVDRDRLDDDDDDDEGDEVEEKARKARTAAAKTEAKESKHSSLSTAHVNTVNKDKVVYVKAERLGYYDNPMIRAVE